jgi:hypothetical protein
MIELKHILALEDDSEILSFTTPKHCIPVWLLVRLYYIRLIISDLLYTEAPLVSTADKPLTRKAAVSILKAAKHNFWHAPSKPTPILIRSTGAGLILRDGLLFNKLSEYFYALRPQESIVLEDLFDWNFPQSRSNNRVIYNTSWRVSDHAKAKIKTRFVRRTESQLFAWLNTRSEKILNWQLKPDQAAWFRKFIEHAITAADIWYDRYQAMLIERGVKVLIAEEAAYGGWLGSLVAAAKDLSIPVAEYQHGMLASGHEVYNPAPSLTEHSNFRRCMPDFFLVYGGWWGSDIKIPTKKVVIGNPHRTSIVDKRMRTEQKDDWILLLGDGRETHRHLQIAQDLQMLLNNRYEIVFRPHPQERDRVKNSADEYGIYKIRIDTNSDIYDSFSNSYAVLSELSTGLFEGIGIVKKIFVWETPKSKFVMPDHPFATFRSASEAAKLILSELNSKENEKLRDTIWAPDWQANYQDFLKSIGL